MKRVTDDEFEDEALKEIVHHYGMPVFLKELDVIIERIKGNILSVPLGKGPTEDSLSLYSERMKAEGAMAVRNAILAKVQKIKEKP